MDMCPGVREGLDRFFDPDDMHIECTVGCLFNTTVAVFEKCSKSWLSAGILGEAGRELLLFLLH
jgi:hypothetical protein